MTREEKRIDPDLVIVVDTETTGLVPGRHALLTVGLVAGRLGTGRVLGTREVRFRGEGGEYMVSGGALRVNRIDLGRHDARAPARGFSLGAVEEFLRRFPGAIGAGHNYPFDRDFLRAAGVDLDAVLGRRYLDTMPVLRLLEATGRAPAGVGSLEGARRWLRVRREGRGRAHTALGDAVATFRVLVRLARIFRERAGGRMRC